MKTFKQFLTEQNLTEYVSVEFACSRGETDPVNSQIYHAANMLDAINQVREDFPDEVKPSGGIKPLTPPLSPESLDAFGGIMKGMKAPSSVDDNEFDDCFFGEIASIPEDKEAVIISYGEEGLLIVAGPKSPLYQILLKDYSHWEAADDEKIDSIFSYNEWPDFNIIDYI